MLQFMSSYFMNLYANSIVYYVAAWSNSAALSAVLKNKKEKMENLGFHFTSLCSCSFFYPTYDLIDQMDYTVGY